MNKKHKQAILNYLQTLPQTVSYSVDIGEEEIHVTWEQANIRAGAIFDEEQEYGYTYYKGHHFVAGKRRVRIGEAWPEDLVAYLNQEQKI